MEWYTGIAVLTKRYDADNDDVRIRWRWYSIGWLLPYWEGSFRGSASITLWPSFYLSLEFNPEEDVNIYVVPWPSGEE